MRTAVVRIDVDPDRTLTPARWAAGLRALRADSPVRPSADTGPELRFQLATDDPAGAVRDLVAACARAFGTTPVPGAVTFLSRGTDDDAHGVLAGFGLTGEVDRAADIAGFDIVTVTLRAADLTRIPESRVLTALEAALNAEVRLLLR
ncbi:hypothetical protein ACFXK0_09155 [Nocardia sp. NPDC059177]|uniref:hypothetical protein n=1 Tax=Nocardia sp. NPDC059177 TaxID=3346759 RepID=UPI00368D8AB1